MFSFVIAEKNDLSHKPIVQQLFLTNILPRGYPTKLKNYGNP